MFQYRLNINIYLLYFVLNDFISFKNSFSNEVNKFIFIHKTPLHVAVEKNDIKMVKLLLSHPKINVNLTRVTKNQFFNRVLKCLSEYNFSLSFKI